MPSSLQSNWSAKKFGWIVGTGRSRKDGRFDNADLFPFQNMQALEGEVVMETWKLVNGGRFHRKSGLLLFYLVSGLLLLLPTQSAPPSAANADIETAHPIKAHVVGIDSGVEQFVGDKYRAGKGAQGIDADPFRIQFGQKVACAIEIELSPTLCWLLQPCEETTSATMVFCINAGAFEMMSTFLGCCGTAPVPHPSSQDAAA